jgi:hypothetical protein
MFEKAGLIPRYSRADALRGGAQPVGPRHSPADVAATLYQAIGLSPETMVHDRQNRPLPLCPEGRAIPGIL